MASRVLLGMSGGIDSSVAVRLLTEQGYEVVGLTLLTYTSEKDLSGIEDAKALTSELNIEHHIVDSRKEFKRDIIDYFVESYLKGETPSPCIHCNDLIKWKFLNDLLGKFNCVYIATGHYVRKVVHNGLFYIQKGIDPAKDQSYYLWNLNQEILQKALFPLGKYRKEDIRKISDAGNFIKSKNKKESMGVCFLQNRDYRDFLKKNLPADHPALQPGNIIDNNNNVIGKHIGYPFYTLGQKRHIDNLPHGNCVIGIIPETNRLIVGNREKLFAEQISLSTFRLTPDTSLWEDQNVFIRIRGIDSVPGYFGKLTLQNDLLNVIFKEPVWALTPGQSLVFYHNNWVIGGGIVKR